MEPLLQGSIREVKRKVTIAIEDRPPKKSFEGDITLIASIAGTLIIMAGCFLMIWTFA
jgi:hypothetical protein